VNGLPLAVAKLFARTEHLPQQGKCGRLLHPAHQLAPKRGWLKVK
jgi:hypothetical protein